jgi:hypothetical protein
MTDVKHRAGEREANTVASFGTKEKLHSQPPRGDHRAQQMEGGTEIEHEVLREITTEDTDSPEPSYR